MIAIFKEHGVSYKEQGNITDWEKYREIYLASVTTRFAVRSPLILLFYSILNAKYLSNIHTLRVCISSAICIRFRKCLSWLKFERLEYCFKSFQNGHRGVHANIVYVIEDIRRVLEIVN